jgi:hypothetical protein
VNWPSRTGRSSSTSSRISAAAIPSGTCSAISESRSSPSSRSYGCFPGGSRKRATMSATMW